MNTKKKEHKWPGETHAARSLAYYYATKEQRKEKIQANGKRYRQKNKGKTKKNKKIHARTHWLKKQFSMTVDEYENLSKSQNDSCGICGRTQDVLKKSMAVDHCHQTGKIRGLLCDYCNRMLGLVFDSPIILRAAIDYLMKYGKREMRLVLKG